MARDAHAYVRGSTAHFYTWLSETKCEIPQGPAVWICGDCHLGNLGPLAGEKGDVRVEIRDLDQTVLGNPAHDIIRLGLSLACAARGSNLSGLTITHMLESLIAGYRRGLSGNIGARDRQGGRSDIIQQILARSLQRRWHNLALERLKSDRPTLPLGRSFWPLMRWEFTELAALVAREDIRLMIACLRGRHSHPVKLMDAAYWVKGCSSLGRLRYALLVRVGHRRNAGLYLIDAKEAVKSAAPGVADKSMPKDNSLRVVAGAKALAPYLGNRMAVGRVGEVGLVLRELTPHDLKIEVSRLPSKEAASLAAYLGDVVGLAHGRQMDKQTRTAWRNELANKDSLYAPSWLWSTVVELLTAHEAAYLTHCREFGLTRRARPS